MFGKERYMTRGVAEHIPPGLQMELWGMIDRLPHPRDYLQVFYLSNGEGMQKIVHMQECPPVRNTKLVKAMQPIWGKVYVVDDGSHATMLLAEEY